MNFKDMDCSNGVKAAESTFRQKVVLAREIPWNGFASSNSITASEYDLISKYDKHSDNEKKEKFIGNSQKYVSFFVNFIHSTSNSEIIQYLLTLINEIIEIDPRAASAFSRGSTDPTYPYSVFFRLLSRDDAYINLHASIALAQIMCAGKPQQEDVEKFFNWILQLLRKSNSSEVEVGLIALQNLLLKDEFRATFDRLGGSALLLNILQAQSSNTANIQLLYETIYSIWLLTYNNEIAAKYSGTGLVSKLVNLIKTVVKEKIVRLSISVLRNLLNQGNNNEEMIDNGFVRMLNILNIKKWGDEDIPADIEVLVNGLAKDIDNMSSFNKYKAEIVSGELEWTPVHKSERFWKENITKFEEQNYYVIKSLHQILSNGQSTPIQLSIACHDLGEFVRHHPRGKAIIDFLQIKPAIMALMANPNEEVKKQALFALQKMMLNNWEYLSQNKN
ncbi:hypothetical protein DICPUDRAFT_156018 [Dictyostelium purpureum]|uniref:V-type proton ATPase subunit H n=1 Tax=Dictyostelium purpureum TaxID=5786 RepID=F0ZVH2_DICPU|nr:uncharacterized protein DICPUDRAFT_156018 [Dictyostelium purpureum]EGC32065.1 hypothetical protein DICPUDRAFT_156018 [Dictyostelium purpureum]|eukprot:XP_003291419.1 hypothetical protein DICPUDRAFT_156018 [Dictyostelium purpureum]